MLVKPRVVKALVSVLLALPAASAWADRGACFLSTEPLSFGTYVTGQLAPLDASTFVQVSCIDNSTKAIIKVDGGITGNNNSRRMLNGASRLSYDLYKNVQRTDPVRNQLDKDSRAMTETIIVYGRIPAAQDVVPGGYYDTLTLTVLP